jgi:hypothetical protein
MICEIEEGHHSHSRISWFTTVGCSWITQCVPSGIRLIVRSGT